MRLRRHHRQPRTATPVVELQQVALGPLRALDLVVYPGERVAVLGGPGSGKTVLAGLLTGAQQPQQGRVRRDGLDVTGSPTWAGELAATDAVVGGRGSAAAGVAWLAQEPRPFRRLTVYENVLVAALSAPRRSLRIAESHARRALSRVDLDLMADRLPTRLTPSQLARMEAARALAAPRRLVVVDQLSGRVDSETAGHIAAALGDCAAEGAAIVWLDAPEAPPAGVDRLVVLAYGRVAQEGPAEQVLATWPFGAGHRSPAGAADGGGSGSTFGPPVSGASAQPETESAEPVPPNDAGSPRSLRGSATILRVRGWTAPEGAPPVVRGLDLDVHQGETVAVIGDSSEQSTVVLRSLAGLVDATGRLWLGDRELTGGSAAQRSRWGIAFVPRDGAVVDRLTVSEHLVLAGARRHRRTWTIGAIYDLFPSLSMARHRPAGALPPLERRCLALARALVTDPPVLLVDRLQHGVADRPSSVLAEALREASQTAAVVLGDVPDGIGPSLASRVLRLSVARVASNEPIRSS